jgi:hypothetical protein
MKFCVWHVGQVGEKLPRSRPLHGSALPLVALGAEELKVLLAVAAAQRERNDVVELEQPIRVAAGAPPRG